MEAPPNHTTSFLGKNRHDFCFPALENTCHQADKRLNCTFLQIWLGVTVENESLNMKTYMAKTGEVEQKWWLVDATDKIVGRLASDIAVMLMGKHRPTYTPHVDTGDFVVVTNVEKIVFTGKKWDQKQYTWYTGYTRLRSELAAKRFEKKPEAILSEAVRRMLPKNKLGTKMLLKLKLYVGDQHPHQAQNPEPIELAVKS